MKCPGDIEKTALGAVGKGILAGGLALGLPSLFGQTKHIQQGKQQKVDWGKVFRYAGVGALAGGTLGHLAPRIFNKKVIGTTKLKPLKGFKADPSKVTSLPSSVKKNIGGVKDFVAREQAKATRASARKGLFGKLLTNPKKYSSKAWKTQVKPYFSEYLDDLKHPIRSLKRQKALIGHHFNPVTSELSSRSGLGKLFNAGIYWGMPVGWGASELINKKNSTGERLTRGGIEIGTLASPKMAPYWLATQIPNLLFNKDKKVHSEPSETFMTQQRLTGLPNGNTRFNWPSQQ